MSKSSGPPPFTGQVVWVVTNNQWAITMANAHGSVVPIQEVFLTSVLTYHLANGGAATPKAALDRMRGMCVVTMQSPTPLDKQAQKLLGVLRTYYALHKGVPVKWSVL